MRPATYADGSQRESMWHTVPAPVPSTSAPQVKCRYCTRETRMQNTKAKPMNNLHIEAADKIEIKWLYSEGVTRAALARTFSVPVEAINAVIRGTL